MSAHICQDRRTEHASEQPTFLLQRDATSSGSAGDNDGNAPSQDEQSRADRHSIESLVVTGGSGGGDGSCFAEKLRARRVALMAAAAAAPSPLA